MALIALIGICICLIGTDEDHRPVDTTYILTHMYLAYVCLCYAVGHTACALCLVV